MHLSVSNLGHASTSNATLLYLENEDSLEFWTPGSNEPTEVTGEQKGGVTQVQLDSDFNFSTPGYGFAVNATNSTVTTLDFSGAPISSEGIWMLYYQKRVIDSSMWVFDFVNESVVKSKEGALQGLLPAPSILLVFVAFALAAINRRNSRFEQ